MNNPLLYEHVDMPDKSFPIKIFHTCLNAKGIIFENHWHEHIEFWCLEKGDVRIECNNTSFRLSPNDLVIVNSNELHHGYNLSNDTSYYCIIMDPSFLQGSISGTSETKYITPIANNYILFENNIRQNTTIVDYIHNIWLESKNKEPGFEFAIKGLIYKLIVLLLRNYVATFLTPTEYKTRLNQLDRFNRVFQYIEDNYSKTTTIHELAKIANLSEFYFCRLFKELTNKTLIEYIHNIRINKAEYLLKNTYMNVTEVALSVGFNDVNYFSRLFKRYKKITPSTLKK